MSFSCLMNQFFLCNREAVMVNKWLLNANGQSRPLWDMSGHSTR